MKEAVGIGVNKNRLTIIKQYLALKKDVLRTDEQGENYMYNLKHHKPKERVPSCFLVENIGKIDILEKPILDIACGYGRNGAFLAKNNHRVVFIDNDIECLKYIKTGKEISKNKEVDMKYIRTLYKNLSSGKLPFPDNSVGGIIDIHYYNPLLVEEMIRVLDIGGFFCFESISARGRNIYELPDYYFIRHAMKNFEIISYFEKVIEPKSLCKSVTKIFGIKKEESVKLLKGR